MKAPPDRLCTEGGTRYFNRRDAERVGIAIDGVQLLETVVEYCVSKGWARCLVLDANGKAQPGALGVGKRTRMVHGVVRVWWLADGTPPGISAPPAAAPASPPSEQAEAAP